MHEAVTELVQGPGDGGETLGQRGLGLLWLKVWMRSGG